LDCSYDGPNYGNAAKDRGRGGESLFPDMKVNESEPKAVTIVGGRHPTKPRSS
jgi:hypothetical protein